jgi:hypothetical protein
MRCSLNSLLFYVLFYGQHLHNLRVDGRAVRSVHELLALSAVQETKLNPRRQPLELKSLLDALYMEYMPTF